MNSFSSCLEKLDELDGEKLEVLLLEGTKLVDEDLIGEKLDEDLTKLDWPRTEATERQTAISASPRNFMLSKVVSSEIGMK